MTVGEVNTRVTELAELHEHDTQDLYALLEDAQDGRSRISQRVDMDSQRVGRLIRSFRHIVIMCMHTRPISRHTKHSYSYRVLSFRHSIRRQDQMVETLRFIRDMRREMSDMQAELLALREQQRRARQPGPEARIPDHHDAYGDADSHI
ncbi:hypothetical protein Tco_0370901 [Tanacetum coccineum]